MFLDHFDLLKLKINKKNYFNIFSNKKYYFNIFLNKKYFKNQPHPHSKTYP